MKINNIEINERNFKKKENLLIINHHFWPDKTACSAILFHIAKNLSRKIPHVEIITSKPNRYKFKISKSSLREFDDESNLLINRLSLFKEDMRALPRILNALHIGFFSFWKILFGNYDYVIATSSPPILTAFLASLAVKIRNKKFIYYCMDINPEIGILKGEFKNFFLKKLMFLLDNFSCMNSSPVIVHSKSMKNSLLKRFKGKKIQIKIINSLTISEGKFSSQTFKKSFVENSNEGIKILYAGNIGRFQGLENIVLTFSLIKNYKNIELTFLGEGTEKINLRNLSKKNNLNIKFLDHVSYEDSKKAIAQSDLGLVSLIPSMYKYAYPSKTMAYLEQGIPILAMIERESEIARDVIKNDIGYVVPIFNHQKLANLLINLSKDNSWKKDKRNSCLEIFKKKFSDEVMLKKWDRVFSNM